MDNPVRVVFCTYPGIFSHAVLTPLLQTPGIKIVGIVRSTRIFRVDERMMSGAIRMIKNSGWCYATYQFMQTDLFAFIQQLIDKPSTRNIPKLGTNNINSQQGLRFIRSLNPDVIVLANFNQKVSPEIIALPKFACLNIHPSLLPDYKGIDPVFAALAKNERYLGVTLHQVNEEIDTGDILVQEKMEVSKNRSVFYHQLKLFESGGTLAAKQILTSKQGFQSTPQTLGGRHDSWPTKAQVKDFRTNGGKLITLFDYWDAIRLSRTHPGRESP